MTVNPKLGLFACVLLGAFATAPPPPMSGPIELSVSASGIFDPSLADTPAGARAWMAYSAVDPSPRWPANTRTVTTRLAYSGDKGVAWTDQGVANPLTETNDGRSWVSEVSSLIYDPTAAGNARWKLFWHHYLLNGEERQFQHGWLGYKRASTPEGLRTATEVKLFAGSAYDGINDTTSGPTQSPVGGVPRIRIQNLGAPDCVALSEPGAMATSSGIYMAVGCYGANQRIILLKCAAPCSIENPASWRIVGTLKSGPFSAANLFRQGTSSYLIVSPVGDSPFPGSYQGCQVFRFFSLDAGALEPTIVKEIHGTPGSFNGACAYAQNVTAAGFLYSEIRFSNPILFQIFKTQVGLN